VLESVHGRNHLLFFHLSIGYVQFYDYHQEKSKNNRYYSNEYFERSFSLPLFHIVSLLLLQVDEVFLDRVVQLDYYIFVEYLLYYNYVVEKKHPNHRNSFLFTIQKQDIHTALAFPPTCMALNRHKLFKYCNLTVIYRS